MTGRAETSVPACVVSRVVGRTVPSSVIAELRREVAYLVECNLPVLSAKDRRALLRALQLASARVTASGSPVRYIGSVFVPARSRCFSLFEALRIDVVRAVNEAALVPYIAINEAIDVRVGPSSSVAGVDGHRSAARRGTSR